METWEYCAPCLFGVEGILGDELRRLGADNVRPENGRVLFSGPVSILARANICSRYAERIQILLGRFTARTFTQLFDGVRALPLERFIGVKNAFPVKGWSLNSQLHSVPDCQSIVKKAAVERLLDVQTAEELYRVMGKVFVPKPGWSYAIISPHEHFEELFGRPADKRRKLYNGMLKCQLYMYYK